MFKIIEKKYEIQKFKCVMKMLVNIYILLVLLDYVIIYKHFDKNLDKIIYRHGFNVFFI